jgi:hypothetical protein
VWPDGSRGLALPTDLGPSPAPRYWERHGLAIVHVLPILLRRIHFSLPGSAGMILCVPNPAVNGPCTLQLATQLGETDRFLLKPDDPVWVLRSNLPHKDRKVTYPCLSTRTTTSSKNTKIVKCRSSCSCSFLQYTSVVWVNEGDYIATHIESKDNILGECYDSLFPKR